MLFGIGEIGPSSDLVTGLAGLICLLSLPPSTFNSSPPTPTSHHATNLLGLPTVHTAAMVPVGATPPQSSHSS